MDKLTKQHSDQIKSLKSLNLKLNAWDYGTVINGKRITDMSKIDWKKFKTLTIGTIEDNHIGICWDFVNHQHSIFKMLGYKDKSYCVIIINDAQNHDITTHTFSVVTVGRDKYWFESSWGKHQGLHKIASYKDVVDVFCDDYNNHDNYDVYEYNPEGLENLTDQGYLKRIISKKNHIRSVHKNKKEV